MKMQVFFFTILTATVGLNSINNDKLIGISIVYYKKNNCPNAYEIKIIPKVQK